MGAGFRVEILLQKGDTSGVRVESRLMRICVVHTIREEITNTVPMLAEKVRKSRVGRAVLLDFAKKGRIVH